MFAEYLASRAIALAASGATPEARSLAEDAAALTNAAEARVLATCALAVAALRDHELTADAEVNRAFDIAARSGHVDSFVTTYRACPEALAVVARSEHRKIDLIAIVENARDAELATKNGIPAGQTKMERSVADLSPREQEVYALLAQGRSNREIAAELFISEATAKVHVRRVLSKLGARSRTEAVVLGLAD
jgi:DNA-binding NarL/FixJ family response regulator